MSVVVLGSKAALEARWYFRANFVESGEWFGPAPEGPYDVAAFLKTLPPQYHNPHLLLIFFEFGLFSQPLNLDAVKCPKVLLISDTHHQVRPLTNAITHALSMRYDLILGQYVRQHLHFFREAGLSQTVWIPGFTLNPFEMPPGPRSRLALFIGETAHHPFRRHVLGGLNQLGSPIDVGRAGPQFAAQEYNRTLINLNISLNGDLNLRTFEILAASGFLLTDRLSLESGLELLFENGRHMVLFDSVEHLRDLIHYYQAHPQEADAIAAQGHAHYLQHHTPARKIQQFHDALAGKIVPEYALDLDVRTRLPRESVPRLIERVKLYECLQEVHRNNTQLGVLFWEGLEREAIDAVDMPRLKVSLLAQPETSASGSAVDFCGLQSRIERLQLPLQNLGDRRWVFLCAPPTAFGDPLFHTVLQQSNAQYLMVPHFDPQVHTPALQVLIQKYGLNRFEPAFPPLLALAGVPLNFV